MSKVQSVAESFETYREHVIPKGASPIQVEECRRAFYAGSYFMLMNVAYNIGDDSTSEDEGVEQLERLKAECEAFSKGVGQPLPTPYEMPGEPPNINYTTPDPDEIRPLLNRLGQQIGNGLPDGYGFNLLIFEYGEQGNLFYLSSARREDVINVMREFIKRQTQ